MGALLRLASLARRAWVGQGLWQGEGGLPWGLSFGGEEEVGKKSIGNNGNNGSDDNSHNPRIITVYGDFANGDNDDGNIYNCVIPTMAK